MDSSRSYVSVLQEFLQKTKLYDPKSVIYSEAEERELQRKKEFRVTVALDTLSETGEWEASKQKAKSSAAEKLHNHLQGVQKDIVSRANSSSSDDRDFVGELQHLKQIDKIPGNADICYAELPGQRPGLFRGSVTVGKLVAESDNLTSKAKAKQDAARKMLELLRMDGVYPEKMPKMSVDSAQVEVQIQTDTSNSSNPGVCASNREVSVKIQSSVSVAKHSDENNPVEVASKFPASVEMKTPSPDLEIENSETDYMTDIFLQKARASKPVIQDPAPDKTAPSCASTTTASPETTARNVPLGQSEHDSAKTETVNQICQQLADCPASKEHVDALTVLCKERKWQEPVYKILPLEYSKGQQHMCFVKVFLWDPREQFVFEGEGDTDDKAKHAAARNCLRALTYGDVLNWSNSA